ncbi:MAG: methionyl-tRNA formyltransferase [Candidatus Margulisbacteria bacterium]|nr:methionyl-tRNA formyltransferase [Candidatus Margulisiibacteriota bacterium]
MKILLFGITQFAVKALKKLILLKQIPDGVVLNQFYSQDIETINLICKDHNIPVYSYEKINNPQFIDLVKHVIKPDLLLVFTFDQKLSPEIYESARYAINMHPSYLPYYRGNNPYFWCIANGEEYTGVTLHFITENFDSGEIIYQEKVPIHPDDTCGMVIAKQEIVAIDLLEKLLTHIQSGEELPRQPQLQGNFPKAPKLQVQDCFIHWDWTSQKIVNHIRALNPYTGSYTQYKNTVLAIYDGSATNYESNDEPGTIVSFSAEGPLIKSGNGGVILKILTCGKKYLLSGNDFIEYEKVQIGEKFATWE